MRNRRGHGFSLIELVVSIAIIATLAGVASVRFTRSAERARVEAATRRLIATIDDARTRARTRSTACKVMMDVGTGVLELKGPLANVAELDTVRLGSDPYRVRIKLSGFGGGSEIEFNGFGRPVSGGTIGVYSGAFERAVVVDPETGHASLQ